MIHCTEETPKAALAREKKMTLEKKNSIQKERQISVDPISLESAKTEAMSAPLHHLLPPAANGKFVSCSLPNSPRFELKKKKHKNMVSPLSRQQSVAIGNLERLRESRMQRSKSCGEGRASQPSMDLDLWASSTTNHNEMINEVKVRVGDESKGEDKFKCGACLFLPGLGKGKAVRTSSNARKEVAEYAHIVSQRVSLEKFECGSWRSSALINNQEDGDATSNLFFDLPLELMRCGSLNDTESPVTAGFVFDSSRKGVLKARLSRHVRFSVSSPASPTSPRLRKARDDFNAFLEAQSA